MEASTSTPTAAAAFYAVVLASSDDVRRLARIGPAGVAGLILSAAVRQYDGDAAAAEAALRRAAELAPEADRPYVVELLAPLLIARGVATRATALLGAATRTLELVPAARDAVLAALPHLGDPVLALRVHQRLALDAYWRRDTAAALEHAAGGVRVAERLGAHRAAAVLHGLAYVIHDTITGDVDAAWHHAGAAARAAEAGGDGSARLWAWVRVYELAAERGAERELVRAREAFAARLLPPEYRDRFRAVLADALKIGWSGDFSAARDAFMAALDTHVKTEGERALCSALIGLVSVAVDDDDAARRFMRRAISGSGRPDQHLPAHEMRARRLARALAAATGAIIGDHVRGKRAAAATFLQGDRIVAALARVPAGATPESLPASTRGYARLLLLVRERYARRAAPLLTAAELEILGFVAAGLNAFQIAARLGRSPHTVRTHLRNAGAKLETHGRLEALARARELGLLRR